MRPAPRFFYIVCSIFSLLTVSLFGEALFIERFDYENGELSAVSSNRWAPTTSDTSNPNLNVADEQLNWDFTGQVADPVNNGYYGAIFNNAGINTGSLYAYFDLEVTEAPIGTENTAGIFLTLWNGGGGNRARTFIAAVPDGEGGIVPDRFRLGITKQSGSRFDAVYYPADWAEGSRLTVLVKSDFDAETVTLFVNPESEADTNAMAIDGTFLSIKGIAVRHRDESGDGNNIGVFRVDNIAVTKTFGDIEAPPDFPPNRVAVSGVPGGGISVNWRDNSNNETGFRVERRVEDETEFSELAVVGINRTHYLDLSPLPGVSYAYRIVAQGENELVSVVEATAQSYSEPETEVPPTLKTQFENGIAAVTFEVTPEVIYLVEESVDIENWSFMRQLKSGAPSNLSFPLEASESGRRFARVSSFGNSIPHDLIGLTEEFRMPENATGSVVSLNDFGATDGNSSDDDSVAFQAAFAAMSFGDVLTVPAGEFHIKSTMVVPSGLTIRGAEDETSILNTIGVNDAFRVSPGSRDVTISNMVIVGKGDQLDHGVFIGEPGGLAPERVWLKGLRIERFNKRAIQVRNAKHVKIEGCRILNALQLGGGGFGYGVTLNDSGNHNNWVTNCFIGPVIRHGVLIQFSAHNNLVEGNTCFETTEDAYDIHGEDEHGNELRFNLAYWDGDSSSVGSPAGFGIGNTGATHDNSGVANWIHHNEVRGYQIGVEVIQGSHVQFIDRNILTANADAGIKIHNGGGNSIYLRGNTITGSDVGVQALRSAGLVVDGNKVSGNGVGIVTTSDIDDYRILNNDLRQNGTAKELGNDTGEYVGNLE